LQRVYENPKHEEADMSSHESEIADDGGVQVAFGKDERLLDRFGRLMAP
jgi:hypothetical protein